jgi:vanillate O-demethylase monooxygenase subunit
MTMRESSLVDLDRRFLVAARPFWHPIARACDVRNSSAAPVTLLGEDLVVWRDCDGHLSLLDDLCSHRGARLSAGSVTPAGCLRCPYHGLEYGRDGSCTRIPQHPHGPIPRSANVQSHQVVEEAGLVWACLTAPGEEARGVPAFPETTLPGWHTYVGEPLDWACQSTRQIENFIDLAHFSVLHADTFGNPDRPEIDPFEVSRSADGWQLEMTYDYPSIGSLRAAILAGQDAQTTDPFGHTGEEQVRPVTIMRQEYRVELPFAVWLASTVEGLRSVLFIANQPITARRCRLFWASARPPETMVPDEVVETGTRQVFEPDRQVVEGLRPERLPLDLRDEVHFSFDRFGIAYRRALVEIGFPGDRLHVTTSETEILNGERPR